MKNILIIGLMILGNSVFGQIPGKRIDGPIVIFDTLTIKEGDVIFLGKGSDPNSGNFIHITTPKTYMTDISGNKSYKEFKNTPQGISSNYNGRTYAIKYFSKVSSKKIGDMILGVISIGPSFEKPDQEIYKQAVNFEAAIQAGEIIKINEIDFTKSSRTIKREMPQFIFAKDGVQPIDIFFDGISKNELYARTLNWYYDHDKNRDENFMRTIENEDVEIFGLRRGILISRILGVDLFADVEYLFRIEFIENGIHLNFIPGGEDGQITEDVSQGDYFDKNGKVMKMYEDFKVTMEQMMNEMSLSLVDYLMK